MATRVELETSGCVIVEFWKDQDIPKLKSLEKCVDMVVKKIPQANLSEPQREKRIAHLRRQAAGIREEAPL